MTETLRFTNPDIYIDIDSKTVVIGNDEYWRKDWDVEVILTRKVKPFGDGSLLSNEDQLFQKIDGKWFYMYLNDSEDSWDEVFKTDDYFRDEDNEFTVLLEGSDD